MKEKLIDGPTESQSKEKKLITNRKKAIVFANLYMIFHFSYFCCAKISMKSFDVNGLDLCLFRTSVVCVTSSSQIIKQKIPVFVPKDMHLLMLIRNMAGLVGFTALVYALKFLPMGLYMILVNTSPFISTSLSYCFLQEKMRNIELMAMLLSFLAVIVIAISKPPQEYNNTNQVIGVVLGMTNAFCMSSVSVTTRKMQSVHYTIVLLSYAVFGVVALSAILILEAVIFTKELRIFQYGW